MDKRAFNKVDFPDFTKKVGEKIQTGEAERGILICGSGIGAAIAANKMKEMGGLDGLLGGLGM